MAFNIACLTPIMHIEGLWDKLSSVGEIYYAPEADRTFAKDCCAGADIVFVNPNKMNYRLDSTVLNDRIRWVVTASTGTNHIDLEYCKSHNIGVISLTKEYDIIKTISSTAEHALALTMALVRNLPSAFDAVKRYEWDYEKYIGRQISNLNVGIMGYGRLGRIYCKYMTPLAKRVYIYDPAIECFSQIGDVLEKCDIISLHVHLDEKTKGMIDKDFINKFKKKPYLINTSRGEIVNEKDVIEAVNCGQLKGYATDVIADELGNVGNSPLIRESLTNDKIIITPHIGGMTCEAQEIAYNGVTDILIRRIKNENM